MESGCFDRIDRCFLPKNTKKYFEPDQPPKNIAFVNHFSRTAPEYKRQFSQDATQKTYGGYTVLFFALQVLYSINVRRVILTGVDHNYSVARTAPMAERSINGRLIKHLGGTNHFSENYFEPGEIVGDVYLDEAEDSFAIARQVFEADGRELLNCSRFTSLRSVPKVELEDALP